MRNKVTDQGLSVQAIAGTHVVLLGFNMEEVNCDQLMGFAIHRTDHTEEECYWLKGQKTFAETDPGFPPGSQYSTRAIRSRVFVVGFFRKSRTMTIPFACRRSKARHATFKPP
ncbi:MAG: hypothetical protein IPK19_20415 [Chloroflexi bacterium]|nr:hypothetical protein [Chloroflexota bacterium]